MEKDYSNVNTKIAGYVKQVFRPEDSILKEIRERSKREGLPEIQVGDMDSLHLEVITRATGAKKAVEIGTLGGYSGVSILRGLSKSGKLYTFEYDPHHASVAKESFKKAGFEKQVEIFVGPAIENLPKIRKQGPFDLVFIDADKESYPKYLEWAAENLKVGGVVLADNTFGFGMIADQEIVDKQDALDVEAIRKFNLTITQSGKFRATILPTGDGLTMGVKIK